MIFSGFLVRRAASSAIVTAASATSRNSALITCKKKELNLTQNNYKPTKNAKLGSAAVPLASSGWAHRKSKGDFFILHPMASEVTAPMESFADLGVDHKLGQTLQEQFKITSPTPFQVQSIPQMINNEHVVLAAETGCGKTLSYLLPVLQNLRSLRESREESSGRRFNTPLALILTPGRELADQIGRVCERLAGGLELQVKTIVGGNTKRLMMNPSFDDVDILVGSIGAVSKLVTNGIYRMERVRHVVLDEADTLLDDSFNEKLAYFLRRFPFHKNLVQSLGPGIVGTQLVLVSATLPKDYADLLQHIVDPQSLKLVSSPGLHQLMRNVPQRFFRMNKSDRPSHLLGIVKAEVAKRKPVLVFSNKTPTADFVSIMLNESGVPCLNLTGDMQVAIREGRFEQFQAGEFHVLSTTDVGSRGLDTRDVAHVINFDFPLHVADYIHRCGRVGRVGSSRGDAQITNFISSGRELSLVQRIEHAARTGSELPDVNANITNIIRQRILRNMGEAEREGGRRTTERKT